MPGSLRRKEAGNPVSGAEGGRSWKPYLLGPAWERGSGRLRLLGLEVVRGRGLGLLVQGKLQVSPVALGALRLGPRTQVKCKGKLCPIVSQMIPDYVKTETGGAWRGKEGLES